MIRILALSAMNQGTCKIKFSGMLGLDIESMINSIQSLGVEITQLSENNDTIVMIHGIGNNGFLTDESIIDCGNSGTALRIIMGLVASLDEEITVIGDESLSHRDNDSMINSLLEANVSIEKYGNNFLPLKIRGPWFDGSETNQSVYLDCSKSSQPLTSWMIASALFPCNVALKIIGSTVSNRHYLLTKDMCNNYGASITKTDYGYQLNKWDVSLPDEITVPGDSSMASFAILLSKIHLCELQLSNWPQDKDNLGNEILYELSSELGINWTDNRVECLDSGIYSVYDLTDCNDLITPLSVIISLGGGGEITGISHTIYKESNRIKRTMELMENFGLKATFDGEKLIIEGGQRLSQPKSLVNCYNDHRLFMTAAILMTKFGGDIIGKGLHCVADVNFLSRLGID
jgi:3-phosphoshikimate 1-carboxyvinyltransferase